MYLSDQDLQREIKTGRIGVTPYDPANIQSNSYELALSSEFELMVRTGQPVDPSQDNRHRFTPIQVAPGVPFDIPVGGRVLGQTIESVRIPNDRVAKVEGKSSNARNFLLVHVTAGWVDSGFEGRITVELANMSPDPWRLWPGMKICQLAVAYTSSPVARPYGSAGLGSHYQSQQTPMVSQSHIGFTAHLAGQEVDAR